MPIIFIELSRAMDAMYMSLSFMLTGNTNPERKYNMNVLKGVTGNVL